MRSGRDGIARGVNCVGGGLLFVALICAPSSWAQAVPQLPNAPAPQNWSLGIRLNGGVDDNVFLDESASSSLYSGLSANLTRRWRWARGNAELGGQGWASWYRDFTELNRFSYAALANLSFTLGRRSTLNLRGNFSSDYTRDTVTLVEAGLLLPLDVVQRIDSSVDFTHRFTAKTSLSVSGRYERYLFDSPQLVDGSALSAFLRLGRQIGARGNLYFNGGAYRSLPGGQEFRSYWYSVGGSRQIGRYVTLSGSLGLNQFPAERGGDRFSPRGDIGLTVNALGTNFDIRYGRSFDQAFGLGVDRFVTLASLRYGRSLGRRLGVWAYYGYSRSEDTVDTSQYFQAHVANLGVNWSLVRNLWLGLGYWWEYRDPSATSEPVTSGRWSFSISYGKTWR